VSFCQDIVDISATNTQLVFLSLLHIVSFYQDIVSICAESRRPHFLVRGWDLGARVTRKGPLTPSGPADLSHGI
jgi:hypothetical protein